MKQQLLTVTYCLPANAAYIRLRKAKVESTRQVLPNVFVDLCKHGKPIGFEVLSITKFSVKRT